MAKMQIKRVGVFSVAKIMGIIMAALGLLIGVIYGLIIMTVGAAMMAAASGRGGIGFIIGLIYGFVYNLASGVVGGIELELENLETSFAPPPQPQQWNAGQYQPGQQQNYPY